MKKPLIASLLLIFTLSVSSQETPLEKELDSLKSVHNICILKDKLKSNSKIQDSLLIEKNKLNTQLSDIESFKIGRTKLDKEKQLIEIKALIQKNDEFIKNNIDLNKSLTEELKTAQEKVNSL